ncbi:MAG: radical SAM protein [Nitrospirota bacterium]
MISITDEIIDLKEIEDILSEGQIAVDNKRIESILDSADELNGIQLRDASILLNLEDKILLETLFKRSGRIKEKLYGRKIGIFVPLYISNECINNCLYCGFRRDNRDAKRRSLTIPEIIKEAKYLDDNGYNRILLVTSEISYRDNSIDYYIDAIESIFKETRIRMLNLNAPPMDIDSFKRIKAAGVNIYQSFQETYHPYTYSKIHPEGMKRDYNRRVSTMDNAISAGIKNLGMGVLLGLYDYKFEVLALLSHINYLKSVYDVIPETLSVPRFRYADGAIVTTPPFPVSDIDLKKIIAVYRLAFPTVNIAISTRESPDLRDEVISMGISLISVGSKTEPGGYTLNDRQNPFASQFTIEDNRSLEEIIKKISMSGLMPD